MIACRKEPTPDPSKEGRQDKQAPLEGGEYKYVPLPGGDTGHAGSPSKEGRISMFPSREGIQGWVPNLSGPGRSAEGGVGFDMLAIVTKLVS